MDERLERLSDCNLTIRQWLDGLTTDELNQLKSERGLPIPPLLYYEYMDVLSSDKGVKWLNGIFWNRKIKMGWPKFNRRNPMEHQLKAWYIG